MSDNTLRAAKERRFFSSWREPFSLGPRALHAFFVVYALNCAVFYQERMIMDAIQWLNYGLLSRGVFFGLHGRAFIQLPPQFLPWIAVHLGLSFKVVAVAYSLGFWLYHYAMALLLYYVFRRRDLATLLVFVIVLHLVHNNFYIVADGMHIVPWALCMLAILQHPARGWPGRVLVVAGASVFALIAISSHLFGLPLCLALAGYAFLRHEPRRALLPALAAIAVTLAAYYLWRRGSMSAYESERMAMVSLDTLRNNCAGFVRYFAFSHAYALAALALLAFLGWIDAARRSAYGFAALCALGYALMIGAYFPPYGHLYHWHCLTPMYAILGVAFFDTRSPAPAMPAARIAARGMWIAALVWAVAGTAADWTAVRTRCAFQTHLAKALAESGKRLFLVDTNQLSTDYMSTYLPTFLPEETSALTAYDEPSSPIMLLAQSRHAAGYWAFSENWGPIRSRYLSWFPLNKDEFVPAIVPAPKTRIQEAAKEASIECPERPVSVRLVDGWLSNYRRPPRLVYTVPVKVVNQGSQPFAARDMENNPVKFGYYWHRDGRILYEDLRAEFLPLNVVSTFHHMLDVQRTGIPRDARLGIDLFLQGRPLLNPEVYTALAPSTHYFTPQRLFHGMIATQAGFYPVEESGAGVWLARRAAFQFTRDLGRFSFALRPPFQVNAVNPLDIEVQCEAAEMAVTHRFADNTPFHITIDAPKAGQIVSITSSREYYPAQQGSWQSLKMFNVTFATP